VFKLPEAWVWDFWLLDDGSRYHLFFLYASRALRDPEARHHRAAVGHAVSDDLQAWQRVPDALVHGDPPVFDDLATWTGSVVRHPDGRWFMFYTGATRGADHSVLQTIGYATSHDLFTWDKAPGPALTADPRWYEKEGSGFWPEEAFRDPWVFPDPAGDGWHMLITARANHGPDDPVDRGVVGHAWSDDLETWEPRAPLSQPGQGFGHLEVLQLAEIDGRLVLVFNCLAKDMPATSRDTGATGGVWVAAAETPLGPFDIANAQQLTDDRLYVGKFIRDRATGAMRFLAFINTVNGHFVGEIADPMTAKWHGETLVLSGE
jgi:beta-fructofuranosidase